MLDGFIVGSLANNVGNVDIEIGTRKALSRWKDAVA